MAETPLAVVFGCEGASLGTAEARFFRGANPLGFMLFGRNCIEPSQVTALVASLREAVGRIDAPVLIDQEGGRVARLKPPHWPAYRAARFLGDLAKRNAVAAAEAVRLNSVLIGADLRALGITVNCAPTVDVPVPGAHEMIGTRAYSTEPRLVASLGEAACDGFLAVNVLPVIKHLPGYGRAQVDSHNALPVIDERPDVLNSSDFVPFRMLAHMPWGMTAHALYTAIDPERPATVSPRIITEIVRGQIGFTGILITDDLSMNALSGTVAERACAALNAGCDLALHCNGNLEEMRAIAAAVGQMTATTQIKIDAAEKLRRAASIDIDLGGARNRLEALFGET